MPMSKALPLLLGALAVAITQTIVVAALSPLGADAGVGAGAATWLLTVFMLASAVVTPVAGRLADVLGYRRVAAVSFLLLCLGSVVAALSAHTGWFPGLVVGRVVQGCSGGAFPALFGLARGSLPAEKLSGVVAGISAMFGVGGALGMVVAGPLVDLAGTPALFWFSLLLGVLSLAGLTALSDGDRTSSARRGAGSPDTAGAVILAAALVALLLGVSQGSTWGWTSPATLGCLLGCVVLFALLAVVERRSAAPLVDPSLVVSRSLVWTNLATLVISVGMFAAVTLLPRFVQAPVASGYGFGYSPSRTGLLLVPTAVMMVVAAPVATNRLFVFQSASTTPRSPPEWIRDLKM
jgi:MFS family permease